MHVPEPTLKKRFRVGEFDVFPDRNIFLHNSDAIHVEPKVVDVLCMLAARQGEVVRRDELIGTIWDVEFGADESLTRAVSLLRKNFRHAPDGDSYIETVPKRGYRLNVPVETAPPVPAPQQGGPPVTPRQHPPPPAEPTMAAPAGRGPPDVPRIRRPWLLLAVAAAILLIAVLLTAARALRPPQVSNPIVPGRIEIGTFQPIGDAPSLAAFATALGERVTSVLTSAGIETARAATPRTHGSSAEFILAGTVEDTGGRYQVQAAMKDRESGTVIWSQEFDRDATQAGDLRTQVAVQVAGILGCVLDIRGNDLDMADRIFLLYVQYCAAEHDYEAKQNLVAYTERLVRADPDSRMAQMLHAGAVATAANFAPAPMPPEEAEAARARLSAFARQTMLTDPDDPLAHATMALSLPLPQRWAQVEYHLLRAISSDLQTQPALGQPALGLYAALLRQVGRTEESAAVLKRIAGADTVEIIPRARLAWLLATQGAMREAGRLLDEVERIYPDWLEIYWRRLSMELFYGDPAKAEEMTKGPLRDRLNLSPDMAACIAAFIAARRNAARGPESDGPEKVRDACRTVQPDLRARMSAALGDIETAFAVGAEINPVKYSSAVVYLFYPEMAAFRRDPRFWREAAKFGLVDYWRSTGKWPDFCRRDNPAPDCASMLGP